MGACLRNSSYAPSKTATSGLGLNCSGYGGDVLQAVRLAEGAHKAIALHPGAAKQPPLGEDDGPGNDAEDEQDEQDGFGDQTAGSDQTRDFAANRVERKQLAQRSWMWIRLELLARHYKHLTG